MCVEAVMDYCRAGDDGGMAADRPSQYVLGDHHAASAANLKPAAEMIGVADSYLFPSRSSCGCFWHPARGGDDTPHVGVCHYLCGGAP